MGIRSAFGSKKWTDMLSVHFADNRPRAGASDPRHGLHDLVLLGVECLVHGKPIVDVHIDDAVAAGAMYLFMPHGLGHGLGMDVHDCENIGERSFDYSLVAERAAQSATCLHRATWRLRPGTILSDEPGIYFIPALVDKCEAEGKFRGIVDYDLLRSRYLDFGGIRIEDDLLVTDTGCRILGDRTIPVTVEELEAVVGR